MALIIIHTIVVELNILYIVCIFFFFFFRDGEDLRVALGHFLDALHNDRSTKMFYFGIATHDRFQNCSEDHREICSRVSRTPRTPSFPDFLDSSN